MPRIGFCCLDFVDCGCCGFGGLGFVVFIVWIVDVVDCVSGLDFVDCVSGLGVVVWIQPFVQLLIRLLVRAGRKQLGDQRKTKGKPLLPL